MYCAATQPNKSSRIYFGLGAFAWACLMFLVTSWVQNLKYNMWYSSSASKMISAFIEALECGRTQDVLREAKKLKEELPVTYEYRGNFKELAARASDTLRNQNHKTEKEK